jgi:restriction endonuclease Mrr
MIDTGVGVTVTGTYALARIDSDYVDAEDNATGV